MSNDTIRKNIYDEANEGRSSPMLLTLAHNGIMVEWLNTDEQPRATVFIENYGGPIRAHLWNTGDYDDDPTDTFVMVEDPDNYMDPPEDA